MNDFYDKLRDFRKEKGFTIREVAVRSGVSPSYISQLENGQRGIPSPEVLLKLSEGLHVSYAKLMEEAGYLEPFPKEAPPTTETVELLKLLRDYPLTYDGQILSAEEKERLCRVLEALFWRSNKEPIEGESRYQRVL
jgi:transcriptional regulator with XRE-family HTH domain